jgi:hypothetical protein
LNRTRAWIFLICLSIIASSLPGCVDDSWTNAEVEMTFNMQDGSTHRLNSKGWFVRSNYDDSNSWYIQVLPDKARYSFEIHFYPEYLNGPGNYDLVQSDAVSSSVGFPDSTGHRNYADHQSGVVRIDSVGFELGDTLSGSFEQIMLDPRDEDDPNPCLYLSDGSFTATNEGPDIGQ